ncbi:MAG: secretion activator protein [Spirosoma sp.]|nr:secretion activator protein [Spirosoma sp.]
MLENRGLAISAVLDTEGGFSNHPKDPGGATNLGVTLKVLSAWRDKACTVADIQALARDEAAAIFGRQYADKVMFNDLPAGLDYAVLDTAVHSGTSRAVKLLQQQLGFSDDAVDGIMGEITLAAVRNAGGLGALITGYCDARLGFMRTLRNWSTFKNGWTLRVRGVKQTALAMAAGDEVTQGVRVGELGQAKATGAVSIASTRSGAVALASVGTTLAAAGTAATQASGALSAFSDFSVVRYALLGLAVIAALGTLGVAMTRADAGATT